MLELRIGRLQPRHCGKRCAERARGAANEPPPQEGPVNGMHEITTATRITTELVDEPEAVLTVARRDGGDQVTLGTAEDDRWTVTTGAACFPVVVDMLAAHPGAWQTASMLLPSGSST